MAPMPHAQVPQAVHVCPTALTADEAESLPALPDSRKRNLRARVRSLEPAYPAHQPHVENGLPPFEVLCSSLSYDRDTDIILLQP